MAKKKKQKQINAKAKQAEKSKQSANNTQQSANVQPGAKAKQSAKSAKTAKTSKSPKPARAKQANNKVTEAPHPSGSGYLVSMSHAPRIEQGQHGLQLIPAAIFAAIVILIVHQYNYVRDMSIYYWSSETAPTPGQTNQVEFFSHYKLVLIEVCAVLVLIMLLYRVVTQQFAIKRSRLYIPMIIYVVFVFLSFLFSTDKSVAWGGWNDRFEGTAAILSYILLLFYVINSVNNERNIKWILYPLAGATVILSAIGISQATGHDFFQSVLGQKLLVPNTVRADGTYPWDLIDQAAQNGEQFLRFTFQNNEIYQTVYNINYVSFYLTLLIPIFGMLFIRERSIPKKVIWGVIFALVVFNILGSASSGGFLGVFIVLVLAIIMLNKRLLKWWKSVACIVGIVVIVGASATMVVNHFGGVLWYDEIRNAVSGSVGSSAPSAEAAAADAVEAAATDAAAAGGAADAPAITSAGKIDYFVTKGRTLTFSLNGVVADMTLTPEGTITFTDSGGKDIAFTQNPETNLLVLSDDRFTDLLVMPRQGEENDLIVDLSVNGDEKRWPFALTGEAKDKIQYRNEFYNSQGELVNLKLIDLVNVPHIGWANNPGFGSGRGLIWSRSLPLIKDTILVGHGADTYCIYFPHRDFIGKHNAGWPINTIIDKPHNMYIHAAVGTGLISLLALLALFVLYVIQSIKLYWRDEFETFASFAGAGIFFGICGFLVSGLVDDSTVSVMPMFYGLLGTGVAINMMIKRRKEAQG